MQINIKNIIICIILIVFISMSFNIILNVCKNEYLKKVIKNDSQEMLKDYIVYNDLNIILDKYLVAIKNNEFKELNDMSLFYAKKSNTEFKELKDSLELSDNYIIIVNRVYVLDKNIYKCIFNIKVNEKLSNEYTVCIKIDADKKYFRVLDFII